MPVLSPTFVPAQAPDVPTELGQQAEGNAQSWMTQAANRQDTAARTAQVQQQTAQAAQTFQAILPALIAKNQADQLADQNDVASATLQQQLRGQWQSLKPQVVADIGKIQDPTNQPMEPDGTPDWNAKYNQYETMQAKYGALANLPEAKQYYDMIEQGKKDAFQAAISHQSAQMMINEIKLRSQNQLNNGIALDTAKNNLDTQKAPAIAAADQAVTIRNKALTDISTQRDALSQMGYAIGKMGSDIGAEQQSPLGSGPVTGSGLGAILRPTARQVDADIGDFATRIMSTVKNIRNINEFRAVTASIPKASDQPDVQNEKIQKLQQVNQILNQRNDYKEQMLRADPKLDPDQADQQVVEKFPFPTSMIAPQVLNTPKENLAPQEQQALDWAKNNPKDPRSAMILQRLNATQ